MRAYQPAAARASSPGQCFSTVRTADSAASVGPIGLPVSPASVLALQRTVGNAAVARMLQQVGATPEAGGDCGPAAAPGGVWRSPAENVPGSPGRPLAEPLRREMEARLGADLTEVRVHSDAAAHDSAEALNAHAYTLGAHVVFQRGRYDPASVAGRRMLAHELTHVIQQRSGPVSGTPTSQGVAVSDPGDRFEREAEAVAARVTSGPGSRPDTGGRRAGQRGPGRTAAGDPGSTSALPVVQRTIGTVGQAAVGKRARRTAAPRAAFAVVEAKEVDGTWRYLLRDDTGLRKDQWVGQADAYDLVEPALVSAADRALNDQVGQLLQPAPAGTVADLLGNDPPGQVALGVGMAEGQPSRGPIRVLWSGGAADCVIVAAVGTGRGWIAHVDRNGPKPNQIITEIKKVGGAQVYLASAIFSAPNPASNNLVRGIVTELEKERIGITAIYPWSSLAMDVVTGAVRTNVPEPDRKRLAGGSGWEALTDVIEAQKIEAQKIEAQTEAEAKKKQPPPT
jgi:hypothetical protein